MVRSLLARADLTSGEAAGLPAPEARPHAVSSFAPASSADLPGQIFALVYRQMHSLHGRWHPDFDDLVQTAAEQALRALPSFRAECELATWTYRICYRTLLRHRRWYRRWARRFTLEAPTADAEAPLLDAAAQLERVERLKELAAALDGLSPKRRAVVMLRDIEGLPIPTIADIVAASPATVRSRLRDGRRDLARLLRATPYFAARSSAENES